MAWEPRSARTFASQAAGKIREEILTKQKLGKRAAGGGVKVTLNNSSDVVEAALADCSRQGLLDDIHKEYGVARPGARPTQVAGEDSTEKKEPSDDELFAEASAVLAEDMQAAIKANLDTWARVVIGALKEELVPVLSNALAENPSGTENVAAISNELKKWFTSAAKEMLDAIHGAGGEVELLRRGGFGT